MNITAQCEHFSREKFVFQGNELLYRFAKPLDYNDEESQKYPLILFLHGAGERGNDNKLQLTHIDKVFCTDEFREKYPCFIIIPQCPEENRWVEVDWNLPSHIQPEKMSSPMKLTVSLLYSTMMHYNIDTQRIYVLGLSMGGYGTWDLITRFPYLFAAAVPVCGGGDETKASKIVDVPVWAFHGAIDKVVPVERTRNMINAIKQNGGTPKYTEYPDLGHLCWNEAFATDELWQWLFSQSK